MRVWIEANELMDEHQAVNRYYRDKGSGEERRVLKTGKKVKGGLQLKIVHDTNTCK